MNSSLCPKGTLLDGEPQVSTQCEACEGCSSREIELRAQQVRAQVPQDILDEDLDVEDDIAGMDWLSA